MSDERRFPIQGGLTVSWSAAERAYHDYARRYGRGQSLERLAERGGFGLREFAMLYAFKDPASGNDLTDRRTVEILAASDVRPA